ncbi:hypothetical protein P7K49_016708 [Saguinus oedipus]|uniref:Uncharacterized protein n=1 Tax=Saguinus oedipus TaxID=9490 RepID=A0ABQ9VCV9_SAGOE|nr:hypothetical protein P7K49_016708 [Saguinus oedipus]
MEQIMLSVLSDSTCGPRYSLNFSLSYEALNKFIFITQKNQSAKLSICTPIFNQSMSTVSYMDEPSQRDDISRLTVRMENTYQLDYMDYTAP